jgi:hypothetical protein
MHGFANRGGARTGRFGQRSFARGASVRQGFVGRGGGFGRYYGNGYSYGSYGYPYSYYGPYYYGSGYPYSGYSYYANVCNPYSPYYDPYYCRQRYYWGY